MRYEDASGAFQASGPVANDDSDTLSAGQRGPATGNLITGEGTQYGAAGADSAAGAHVTTIAGKGGEDSSFAGGKLSVAGEHGQLSVDAEGNYSYLANKGAPENVRDRFVYTLADNQGNSDTAALIVEIGKTPAVIKADAQQIVVGPDGVVTLPAGVELSDIMVVGRNLVVNMPDGTQLVILDGAVFVPQLQLGGVEVPATNVAALLIGQEPQPAAGETPPSSGGNFALPPPPLDPGVPLGDLIPPTEYTYTPPEPQEVFDTVDNEPVDFAFDILIDDDTLPGGLAGGIGDGPDAVNISGFFGVLGGAIGGDGPLTFSIELTGAPEGFAFVSGGPGVVLLQQNGVTVRTITFDPATGEYEVTQNAPILHPPGSDENDLVFVLTVTVTDVDGDTATGTITITHNDDTPEANDDTDALAVGQSSTDGNVHTGVGTTSGSAGIDFHGADGASLTSVSGAGGSDSTFEGGFLVVNGQYGVLTIDANGNYTYVKNADAPGGVQDVFTYTNTDGDGDPTTATLTITIPDQLPDLPNPPAVLLDDDALANGNPGGTGDDVDSQGTPGQLNGSGGDGDLDYNFTGVNTLPAGFTVNVVDASTVQILQGGTVVLTITLDNDTGAFNVVQNNPIDHPPGSNENNLSFSIGVEVEDEDGDTDPATITINVDDDTPEADPEAFVGGLVDEDDLPAGNNDNAAGDDDPGNADGDNDGTTTGGGAGSLFALFSIGADQPGTVGLSSDTSGLPALTSNGVVVTYAVVGNVLTASAGGSTVFTLTVNADGSWTFDLEGQLDHPVAGTEDNLELDFSSILVGEDADGDEVTAADGTFVVTVDDDLPVADPEAFVGGLVDEDDLPAGNDDNAVGDDDPGNADGDNDGTTTGGNAGSLAALFNAGADQPLTNFGLSTDTSGLPALTSGGVAVTYLVVGDTLTASAGGSTVFTLTVNADGSWEFDLEGQLDHPIAGTEDDLLLDLSSIIEAEDADGDPATAADGTFVITVDDDLPVANDDTDTIAGGGTSASGNVITGVGTNEGAANADSPGADSPATITAASSVNEPGNTDTDPDPDVFEIEGEFGVLVLNADGSYTYTRNDGAPGDVQDVFTYTLTDADGDSTTATLTINIGDAAPVLPDPALVRLDDDALTDGNPGGAGDDPDSAGLPGQLNGSGGDGALTYNFTGDFTLPAGFTYNQVDDNTAQILQGATVVLTIELNQATGAFNVVQNNPIDHPVVSATEDNLVFQVGVEVEDADGDVEPATITINVDDDTPVLENVTSGAGVDVDETDAGSPAGFPISDTSDDPVIDFDALFGADGPAAVNSIVYGLAIVGGSPEPSGLATAIGDHPITLVQIDADTIEGQYEDGGTQVAFTIQMNADGTVTLTQEVPLEHLVDGDTPADYNDTLDLDGLVNATVTITDGDGDSTSGSAPIGDNLVFFDDGPDSQADGEATLDQLVLDETRPLGQDSDSGDNNPGGLATTTANFANNFVSPVDYGGDGAGTTAYSLFLSADDIGSGLYALDNSDTDDGGDGDGYGQGNEITLSLSPDGLTITGSEGGTDYFTIEIDPVTGVVTFTQLANVWHADTSDDDDTSTLSTASAANVQVVQTVTDSDGDFDTDSVDVGQGVFHIEDDGPEILQFTDAQGDNTGPTPSAEGIFDFDIGTDAPNGDNDDIFVDNFNVQINGVDATNIVFNEGAEDATTASYSFTFTYATGPGTTANAAGTLVFDKIAGTYTVTLTSGPIEGFSILQTSAGTLFQGYEFGTSTLDGSQPEISVTQIQGTPGDPQPDDLFVQFTSVSEPSSGTGDNALEVTDWVPGDDNPPPVDGGGDSSWSAGQLFNQDDGWVSTSNDANGVDGDTIQGGEVLDFTLVQGANPTGVLADPSTYGQASSMFLKFDGIGTGEDMIVILKLYDPILDIYTTKAIMIQNSDIQKGPGSGPGIYSGITLDNNDGLVIIESNDYNEAGENWVIVGAQIAGSDEGVTGTAINLNSAIGEDGGSDLNDDGDFDDVGETQDFSTDSNEGPFKISSIGFVTESTTDQSAEFNFDVTITDADGDSESTSLTATIGDTDSPMPVPFAAESSESTADSSSFSLLASDSQEQQVQKSAANSNTLTLATAIAAAGISSKAAAHDNGHDGHGQISDLVNAYAPETVEQFSIGGDSDSAAVSMLAPEPSAEQSAPADTSSSSSADSSSSNSLDDSSAPAAADSSGSESSGDEGPAPAANDAAPVAPAVAMVSAEALQAAGVDGDAQQGSSVEQVVADALGQGDAPTVDGVLANLPGGIGQLAAIAHMASPASDTVSAWDMGGHGASGAVHDMMLSMHAPNMHHDAVQPAVNG